MNKPFFHYVIHASVAVERKNAILENFHKYGIEPQFFEAVMGNKLSPQQLEKLHVDTGIMSLGEVGCTLPHLGIYRKLLESQEPYVFVFEDDAYLNAEFFRDLSDLMHFLDNHPEPIVFLLHKVIAHTKTRVKRAGKPFIRHCLAGSGGYGYAINRKAAENMLRLHTFPRMEIDAWAQYKKLNLLDIFCTEEDLVTIHEENDSNSVIDRIAPRAQKDRKYLKKMKRKRMKNFYRTMSGREKMVMQAKRLWHHIQEFYYDKEVQPE